LWITALLAMFALYYSSSARVQALQAMNTEKWLMNAHLLRSGLDWGYHEYSKYKTNQSLIKNREELEEHSGQRLDLKYPRQEPYKMIAGNHTVAVQITDLSGKISISAVDDVLLQDILSACGLEEGVEQTTVINSILDWMDQDDMHRPEGAEEDYYLGLDPPYMPKNGELESIEELLLIKGIDRELFQGTKDRPGLRDFLTVYGEHNTMDINNAAPEAFLIIEDFPLDAVQDIIAYRNQDRIEKMADIADIVPFEKFGELQEYFSVQSSVHIEIVTRMISNTGEMGQSMRNFYQIGGS
jgi:general secretion pathway protein K